MASMTRMTGQLIYENFFNAPGPGRLIAAQEQLTEVRDEYGRLQEQITQAAAALEEHWQGEASGAAQRGAGPLAVAHGQARGEMEIVDNLLTNQIDSFHAVKNSVQPVPSVPPMPASFSEMVEGGTKNYFEATTAANDAARRNVSIMESWTKISHENEVRMPMSYGTIAPDSFGVSQGSTSEKPGAIGGFPGAPAKRKGTGKVSEPPKSGAPAPEPSAPPPAKSTMDQTRPTVPVCGDSDDEYTRPERNTPSPKPEPALDTPRPPTAPPKSGSEQAFFPPSTPGTPITRPGVPVTGRTGGPGTGRIGAPVTGGGNAGGRLGGGQGSGVTGPRGLNEAGVRGAGGSAGKAGAGGMAPGVVGQRGKGGEDEDHQRKYVLDDDSHFQPTEKGEKIVDPATGMPPAQPVIGK